MPLGGKKMYEQILDQMQELLKDEIENFGGDIGKLEQAVMTMMTSFGKGLLQRLARSRRSHIRKKRRRLRKMGIDLSVIRCCIF